MIQYKNNAAEQYKQDSSATYGRVLDILNHLVKSFREERAAIRSNNLDQLQRIGNEQEQLLDELKQCFPSRENASADQSRQLQQILRKASAERVYNYRLLEIKKDDLGNAISTMAAGRRTLKAYHPFGTEREELFLKKKC